MTDFDPDETLDPQTEYKRTCTQTTTDLAHSESSTAGIQSLFEPTEVLFHDDDKDLPIHSINDHGLEVKDIFKLCFGEVAEDKICKKKPIAVKSNSVFVIDLSVVSLKSLYADDHGVWETASPSRYYNVVLSDGCVHSVGVAHKGNYTHRLTRQYGKHKATHQANGCTFQRIISTARSCKGSESRYAVLQYLLKDCDPGDIIVAAHGNSRGKRPFYKSDPSVFEKVKRAPETSNPKNIFKAIEDDVGGPVNAPSASEEPRNLQQIYNVRRSEKRKRENEDESQLGQLISQIQENEFVRNLTINASGVQYVVATEKQIKDMVQFCTNKDKFSVLSVDSTFDVGDYYITNTCFENFRIVHADGKYRGKHPVEMGPSFVHTKKDTNDFVNFFGSLIRINPLLRDIRAVGTDGDEALMNASLICFQDATQLLCTDHKKRNIEKKLSEMAARPAARRHIMADIFGKKTDFTHERGLIDCKSDTDFDTSIVQYQATWDHLVPGFYAWFHQYQSDLFKNHLIEDVRKRAQVDGLFSNNRVESINDKMKDWLGRKGTLSMPVLNKKLEDVSKAQEQEYEMSVYGHGSYDLAPEYKFQRKDRHEWNTLNREERSRVLDEFWKSKPKGKCTSRSMPKEKTPKTLAVGSQGEKASPARHLSVPYTENFNFPGITKNHTREIWRKAEDIASLPYSVSKAPGYENACFVQNSTKMNEKPQLVNVLKSGKVSCECSLFKASKLCSHVLVGADFCQHLDLFVSWREAQKHSSKELEDMVLTTSGVRKTKVAKPRLGGRNPMTREPPINTTTRQGILERDEDDVLKALDEFDKSDDFEIMYTFQTKATMCYGCSKKFDRAANINDLIVRKFCEREFSSGGNKKSKWQYAYFHLNKRCLLAKFPGFKVSDLIVSTTTKDCLTDAVRTKLEAMGVIDK